MKLRGQEEFLNAGKRMTRDRTAASGVVRAQDYGREHCFLSLSHVAS